MEVFMTAVWCIWKERNAYIFSNKVPSVAAWKALLTQEVTLQLCRFHPSLHPLVMIWLQSF